MARHSWIGSRNRRVEIARVTDNPVELLIELNRCSEKPPVCIGPVRPGVGEIYRLRFPIVAQELLETTVKKTQPELNPLAQRQRPPDAEGELQRRRSPPLFQCEKKSLPLQVHVTDEDLDRPPNRRLFSDEQGQRADIGEASSLREP